MPKDKIQIQEELTSQFTNSYGDVVDKLGGWVDSFIINLPNVLVATIVFAISYLLSQLVKKYVNKLLLGRVKQTSFRSLIATVSSIIVIALGIFIILDVLSLDKLLKSLLAGAGVAGLAIGLALQSSLSNTFSGIYLSLKDVISVGDWIETNGYEGAVHDVNLRNTVLREPDNNLVMIPNRMVVENPFKNYGLTKQVRVIVNCGVGYESDLDEVEQITKKAIEENFHRDETKEIEFHYLAFGSSSIDFQVRFWIDANVRISILEARSKAIKVIKRTYDEKGINIPFPIRTVRLDKSP